MTQLLYLAIDDAEALAQHRDLMHRVWPLHRQLRTAFEAFEPYFDQMARILDDRGRLLVVEDSDHQVVGLALYRMHHNTYQHKLFFLEDLVVDEALRGQNIGEAILKHCEQLAAASGCHYLSLDSGTFRTRAHKFYYRHDYVADCFHFSKKLH